MLNLSHFQPVKIAAKIVKQASLLFVLIGVSQSAFAVKTEAQAAEEAKAKHGGKVVEVKKLDDKFKIKLLQNDGRVVLVTIAM